MSFLRKNNEKQEEYYSLEDLGSFFMIRKSIKTIDFIEFMHIKKKGDIIVKFPLKSYSEGFPMFKKDLIKIYSFIKLIYKEKYMNLLVFSERNYEQNDILNKINNIPLFKSVINLKLGINEFPLINFTLIEPKKYEENNEYAKIYYLIYKKDINKFNNKLNKKNSCPNIILNNNIYKNVPNSMHQMNGCFNMDFLDNNNPQNYIRNNNLINNYNNISNNLKDNNHIQKGLKNDNLSNNKNIENKSHNFKLFIENDKDYFPLIGLKNVGLTCYMNAILQCLLHINELNNFFFNIYPENKEKFNKINNISETKGKLSEQYYKVIKGVYDKQSKKESYFHFIFSYFDDNSFSPKEFNDILSELNPQFGKYESNDAKDLLLFLIQSMHSELNYYGDKKLQNLPRCNQLIEKEAFDFFLTVNNSLNLSIFSYLFYGITKSVTICSKCQKVLYNFQFFHFLSLPTFNYKSKTFNIYKGLKDFKKVEYMFGDNQFYCQNCKDLQNAKIKTVIYYTPPYLIINIDYGKNKQYEPREIEFGEVIDLTGFVDIAVKEKTYKLICICSHIGKSGNSGHYVTYCKDKNDIWHEFNDSIHIEKINKEKLNKNSPYILIYQRIKQENY